MIPNLHIKIVCQLCGDTTELRTGELVSPGSNWMVEELGGILWHNEAERYNNYEYYLCPKCLRPYIEDSGPDGIYYDWEQLGHDIRISLGLAGDVQSSDTSTKVNDNV